MSDKIINLDKIQKEDSYVLKNNNKKQEEYEYLPKQYQVIYKKT